MSDGSLFETFRRSLSVRNADDISAKYANITARLNQDFWGIDDDTRHSLQVGSYGRKTAIDGVSDLDMVFELPAANYERYRKLAANRSISDATGGARLALETLSQVRCQGRRPGRGS